MDELLSFYKYHGTGNDFILVEDASGSWEMALQKSQIASLCNRHFGIGADGLMLLQKTGGYDFRMVYYNADGRESTFCGNGSRCMMAFAHHLGWIGEEAYFVAADGDHEARIDHEGRISVHMRSVLSIEREGNDFIINSGSPHYIRFVKDVEHMDLNTVAHSIRCSDPWKVEGINVNLVQEVDDMLLIRTYERGVEDETLSCGTGVTAAAIAWASLSGRKGLNKVEVQTKGGMLDVHWEAGSFGYRDIWLTGPAKQVFSGICAVPKQ